MCVSLTCLSAKSTNQHLYYTTIHSHPSKVKLRCLPSYSIVLQNSTMESLNMSMREDHCIRKTNILANFPQYVY
jgi:hypothetical protein